MVSTLELAVTPEADQKVTVVRRVGQSWTNAGESLVDAKNDIAEFPKARTVNHPNKYSSSERKHDRQIK